jgi:hypothetical protein
MLGRPLVEVANPRDRVHVLRHTFVTGLVRAGNDVVLVAEFAGWVAARGRRGVSRRGLRGASAGRARRTRASSWRCSSDVR